jgi:tRNA(Ile)-lysidine synthase
VTPRFRELAHEAAGPLTGRCTFSEAPGPLSCAVSGGADSLALLVLAAAGGREVVAHHVDHGLREGSATDVQVVRDVAGALGAEVVVHAVEVGPGPNLEARARVARLGALPPGTATGHTADDQAETVLLNMLRGAATDGLAAMRAGASHPILGLRRAETHELCARLGVRPVEDVTNNDPAHLRNRVRHELLPALCELAGRDVVPILARQARLMADDASLLDELASGLDPTDARSIAEAPLALARRALREWLRCDHPPDSATVDRVMAVAAGGTVAAEIGAGRSVRRSHGRLRLEPPEPRPG